MKVTINEKEYSYTSDYPTGWKFISKDYFKYPVEIGKNPCFIKRFEMSWSRDVSGWHLLEKLKYKNIQNLPRVYDIVNVEENRRQVNYVFYQYVKGTTLDVLLAEGTDENKHAVDLERLTNDLLLAFGFIHKHDFWFADFCEKNIISTDEGKFFLIDIDSCQPQSQPPDNGMDVNMVYWVPVFKYYKEILHVHEI